MKKIFHLIFLLLLASCTGSSDKKIEEEDFIEIMTRLHVGDALKQSGVIVDIVNHPDSIDFRSAIWNEYGYTKAEFDSTIKWYSRHPDKMNEVYQKVLAHLTELDKPLNEEKFLRDTVIYKDTTTYRVIGDDIPDAFQIKIPDMGIGVYTVRVYAHIYNDDKTYKPGLLVFAKSEGREKAYAERGNYRGYVKDGRKRLYTVNHTIRNMPEETYFVDVLYIPENGISDQSHVEIKEIEIRYRP
ncbi:MAG: DUF4296 domain-containing protein [Bacteroidetes bacterium]|jgi:hypothetical protein|nr:DUF4296 domain-containing protein [Bacteroidota bacterium]